MEFGVDWDEIGVSVVWSYIAMENTYFYVEGSRSRIVFAKVDADILFGAMDIVILKPVAEDSHYFAH